MATVTPVTKELLADLPYGTVLHYDPFGIKCKDKPTRWRTNGKLKTWKSPQRQHEFRQPVKHGLRDYDYITELDAEDFHLERECPNGYW